MYRPMIAAGLALALAGCAGGTGPQDIRIDTGPAAPAASVPAPPAPGPHMLGAAERRAVQAALGAGQPIAAMAARRGNDGVVSVCGTLASTAPFLGILTETGGNPGFSLSGIGQTDPEARAVRKICSERGVTI